MPSNLDFDPNLLAEAQKLSGLKYKKEVVNLALTEYVNHHKQMQSRKNCLITNFLLLLGQIL